MLRSPALRFANAAITVPRRVIFIAPPDIPCYRRALPADAVSNLGLQGGTTAVLAVQGWSWAGGAPGGNRGGHAGQGIMLLLTIRFADGSIQTVRTETADPATAAVITAEPQPQQVRHRFRSSVSSHAYLSYRPMLAV